MGSWGRGLGKADELAACRDLWEAAGIYQMRVEAGGIGGESQDCGETFPALRRSPAWTAWYHPQRTGSSKTAMLG